MKFETMLKLKFKCVGENFKNSVKTGFCGDVHTLDKWLEILFLDKYEYAKEYFEGDNIAQILDYILITKGKRLKKELKNNAR